MTGEVPIVLAIIISMLTFASSVIALTKKDIFATPLAVVPLLSLAGSLLVFIWSLVVVGS